MWVLIAYTIVILFGFEVFTISGLLSTPVQLLLYLLLGKQISEESFAFIATLVSGTFCALTNLAFAWLVFRLFVGVDSFKVFPFLASLLPMLITLAKDFGRYGRMKAVLLEGKDELGENAFKAVSEIYCSADASR